MDGLLWLSSLEINLHEVSSKAEIEKAHLHQRTIHRSSQCFNAFVPRSTAFVVHRFVLVLFCDYHLHPRIWPSLYTCLDLFHSFGHWCYCRDRMVFIPYPEPLLTFAASRMALCRVQLPAGEWASLSNSSSLLISTGYRDNERTSLRPHGECYQ